jgi:hypothetical protein
MVWFAPMYGTAGIGAGVRKDQERTLENAR